MNKSKQDLSMGMSALRCCDNGDLDEKHDCLRQPSKQSSIEEIVEGIMAALCLDHKITERHAEQIKNILRKKLEAYGAGEREIGRNQAASNTSSKLPAPPTLQSN